MGSWEVSRSRAGNSHPDPGIQTEDLCALGRCRETRELSPGSRLGFNGDENSNGKIYPFLSLFPDSRDRFSAPVPSDWLLFPWKLLSAYSKPPSPSSWTKTPLPSPKPTAPLPPSHPQQQRRGVKSGKFWAGGRCSLEGRAVGRALEQRE